ncbi:MAG: metalloregulator ArsR/SmtB family transcription factor [Spirochaetota bacterium]|nr:metalloregulator ArsR/SmtB family transcription factor [Spirochaetota bacterium]
MNNEKLTNFLKALCDETRQKILFLLMESEKNVSELVDNFKISQPTISHHLNILKNAGLVSIRKEGKLIYYRLNCNCFEDCCKDFFDQFGFCIKPKGKK